MQLLNTGAGVRVSADFLEEDRERRGAERAQAAEASALEDQRLVELAQDGDKDAYGQLVTKYSNPVFKLMLGYLRNEADARDAAQVAFIKAWMAIGKFRGDARFFTWLYRIALNVARTTATTNDRKWNHVPLEREEDLLEVEEASLADKVEQSATERLLADTLDSLPSSIRDAFCFRELQGCSYAEIAEIMSCPAGTVRSRIFRARAALEQALQKQEAKTQ